MKLIYNPANIAAKDIDFDLMNDTYFLLLCRYAKKTGVQNVEDIVQDLFALIWEKREILYIDEELNAYLHRSVRNICLNRLIRKKKMLKYCEYVLYESPIRDDNNSLSVLESQETAEAINKAINKLPEQQKAILLLWAEKASYRKIAETLNISLNTVRTQITRAKETLRKLLGNERK